MPLIVAAPHAHGFGRPKPLELPPIFTDHMVVQRDMPIPFWGGTTADGEVTVTFAGRTIKTQPNGGGGWRVEFPAMEADGKSHTLVVTAGEERLELKDIVVGEVWLASGQSNMAQQLYKVDLPEGVDLNEPDIRMMAMPNAMSSTPTHFIRIQEPWQRMTPKSARGFSAVAFFFARRLQAELDVPVGIIVSALSNRNIECFTPPSGFAMVPELKDLSDPIQRFLAADREQQRAKDGPKLPEAVGQGTPTVHYHAIIDCFRRTPMRGAIWYQGESNGGDPRYRHKLRALVEGWRHEFNRPDLPFYYVQMQSTGRPDCTVVRLEMAAAERMLGNVGMVVTVDACRGLHPMNKLTPGERLAAWALAEVYGKAVPHRGPRYKSHRVDGSSVTLEFDHTAGELFAGKRDGFGPIKRVGAGSVGHFQIAGEDRQWHRAAVRIEGDRIMLASANVAEPVAVRYCVSRAPTGPFVYNADKLPLSPFRTDDWEIE